MKRILVSATVALIMAVVVCGLSWLAGFNFDQRGSEAFGVASMCIYIGGIAFMATYHVPRWRK